MGELARFPRSDGFFPPRYVLRREPTRFFLTQLRNLYFAVRRVHHYTRDTWRPDFRRVEKVLRVCYGHLQGLWQEADEQEYDLSSCYDWLMHTERELRLAEEVFEKKVRSPWRRLFDGVLWVVAKLLRLASVCVPMLGPIAAHLGSQVARDTLPSVKRRPLLS